MAAWETIATLVLAWNLGGLLLLPLLFLALHGLRGRWPRLRYCLTMIAILVCLLMPLGLLMESPGHLGARGDSTVDAFTEGLAESSSRVVRSPAGVIISTVWLVGFLFHVRRTTLLVRRHLRHRRTWRPASEEIRTHLEWPDEYRLMVGEAGWPAASAIPRAVAFLPSWAFKQLSTTELRWLGRHELAHLRWKDPHIELVLLVTLAFGWLAPPLRWMIRRARLERELACDHWALEGRTEIRRSYSSMLARVGAWRLRLDPAVGAAGSLEARVDALLTPSKYGVVVALISVSIFIGGVAAVAHAVPYVARDFDGDGLTSRLDRRLGFNPAISVAIDPRDGTARVSIEGQRLSPRDARRFVSSISLDEREEIVRRTLSRPDP